MNECLKVVLSKQKMPEVDELIGMVICTSHNEISSNLDCDECHAICKAESLQYHWKKGITMTKSTIKFMSETHDSYP